MIRCPIWRTTFTCYNAWRVRVYEVQAVFRPELEWWATLKSALFGADITVPSLLKLDGSVIQCHKEKGILLADVFDMGVIKINREAPPLEEQERLHPELELGGRFRPSDCRTRHRVAIIVSYRDRAKHLPPFLNHMHSFLQKQQLDYAIYIVEQAGNDAFNKGLIMNIGALESLKLYQYDCFVFHDVDLLPEDDRNLYTCPDQPRHLAVLVDTLFYKILYKHMFGGVVAMTVDQFKHVNGFSNEYFGWGAEDDDMGQRVRYQGLHISRYPSDIARYKMLAHKKAEQNPAQLQKLKTSRLRFRTDGLNSIKYKSLDIQLHPLYTYIYIELYPS
ncbi:beta-1,4-N-acetylgalactosaminyltransferase bre-4-like [Palaemon carinicauda]|uniref:beta-1,4-N-acetylgalactosaminyltransferase bre-4-like n=1 Tax=Palaemon carinicauda TaxID=392227 RepID=UPI0035B643EF